MNDIIFGLICAFAIGIPFIIFLEIIKTLDLSFTFIIFLWFASAFILTWVVMVIFQ